MYQAKIFDIKTFAVHDGPGIRTTFFFKGCPMECVWCHNPEGISMEDDLFYYPDRCIGCGRCVDVCKMDALRLQGGIHIDRSSCDNCGVCAHRCPSGAMQTAGYMITVEEAMDIINRYRVFYETSNGGVTFSGGEPLMQHEFLTELAERCREEGIHVALDTSGHVKPDIFTKIIPHIDLFLYDIKSMDESTHKQYTGVSNRYVLDNLRTLSDKGKDSEIWLRMPLIDQVTCEGSNLCEIIDFLSEIDCSEVYLLPHHDVREKYERLGKEYFGDGLIPPDRQILETIMDRFISEGYTIKEGG